jgi:signal transduction histidine kinase
MRASASAAQSGFGLTNKLALLVLAIALALGAFLALVVAPRTARAVEAGTEPLLRRSAEALESSTLEVGRTGTETLRTLIERTTAVRRAMLADLPLDVYEGDSARIGAAIEQQDTALGRRMIENVGRLAAEMDARAARRIESEVAALAEQQRQLAGAIADDLQRSSLFLLGGVAVAFLLLLAVAVHWLVVRPVREVTQAVAGVAEGRLDVALRPRGDDEIARLVRAFAGMVEQLRATRAEVESKRAALARLNAELETEVARKTAELQQALDGLRGAQKDLVLAERMASVGTLAGGIAHEFNNLAGGILGCAREVLAVETEARRREPLEVIARAAERAIDVTDKLLRFARPSPPGTSALDLGTLLREAMALVEPQARRQGVATRLEVAGELPVRGDGGALHQVLVNLLGNALQAMPGGGELAVRGWREGDEVVAAVRDDGVGIAAADLDRIFDPFFSTRGGDAATPGRGAGLGLAVSYRIVQAHGGRMQVDSRRGAGSTFTMRLPALAAGGETKEAT